MNSTIGELFENEKTRPLGELLDAKLDAFFGMGDEVRESEAGSDAFNEEGAQAIMMAQPLRGIINFGIMTPDELRAAIDEYTK